MPQGLSFIGWLLERLIFYWLAPPSKLIFIGWLLLRTASKAVAVEVGVGGGTASTTGPATDSSISSVGKTHMPVSTYGGETELLLSVLSTH